ncbi:hypothetical protein BURPS406E_P0120 [Burkholderia pseudomallei 406e]|uniref:Uncharacterized protein n=1 Tax=Burkholderia mallei (strain NCTC 10229) TaxID=412022 RepID=A2S1T0_BURM9|nr:hypothetical protein BMA10229_2105 [Burkholderia mallei NCTC 10229]EDK61568.1 hypothetical protein BMAJHU_I0666 [Burkholderia mallei JHU]EDO86776.1 hypothetical protein BURPS406E_P0120 [Burkholderia pseudomallei 406e]EEH29117.1 conserved hypothetical protein [Burkholderia pseudomallei Pakistan 9]EES46342.1 hypothetical protein BMAPRL20_1551 [Burkholderia mallei PRL-20]
MNDCTWIVAKRTKPVPFDSRFLDRSMTCVEIGVPAESKS